MRAGDDALIGECELHLTWATVDTGTHLRVIFTDGRNVFIIARAMLGDSETSERVLFRYCWAPEFPESLWTIEMRVWRPSVSEGLRFLKESFVINLHCATSGTMVERTDRTRNKLRFVPRSERVAVVSPAVLLAWARS